MLVGMMGAGKSAVGRLLAERLERPFVDADDALEAKLGRTIPQVFAEDGEDGFRREESAVLTDLLDRRPAPVIATGGGVVVRAANREVLRERATVVWLQAPVAELARRVGSGSGRPLLAGDPLATLTELEAARGPLYADVAGLVLDTTDRDPGALAEQVASELRGRGERRGLQGAERPVPASGASA